MNAYRKPVEIRWSDLDPNFHLRHSVYYDFAAYCRISFLNEHQVTNSLLTEQHIGPILFREECVFRKEIKLADPVTIELQLVKSRKDYSRWSIRHHIYKSPDVIAAIITVDGAWMDTLRRKLAIPSLSIADAFSAMPKSEDYNLD